MDRSGLHFPGQFLIGELPEALPPRFRRIADCGGVAIAIDESLKASAILARDGAQVGHVLGLPIDMDAQTILHETLHLGVSRDAGDTAIAQAAHERLAGSYLLIVESGQGCAIVPDASATMGLVFDTRHGLAGSSAQLVLGKAYETRFRPDLVRAFGARGDGWFTAGLTAHDGLERLLPNHRLELPAGTITRGGMQPMPDYTDAHEGVVDAIAAEVATVTGAVLKQRAAAQTLTGGHETRAMLAANRAHADQLEFVTLAVPGAERDVALARKVAALAGLSHSVLPGERASSEQAEAWSIGVGHAMAGMNRDWHPSVAPLDGEVLIGGLGGEVGRGFLWPDGLQPSDRIDPQHILQRLKLPRHALLSERVAQWLDNIQPGLDAFQILDLAYLELRMGPWAFGQGYPLAGPRDLHPLISHRQFARMWSLQPEFRARCGLPKAMVRQCWPELAGVPINRFGDLRDIGVLAKLMLRKPDRVLGRLRQLVG